MQLSFRSRNYLKNIKIHLQMFYGFACLASALPEYLFFFKNIEPKVKKEKKKWRALRKALQFLMPHQLEALKIGFKSLFFFSGSVSSFLFSLF